MKKITLRVSSKKNPQVASYLTAIKKGQKNQHVVPTEAGWKVKSAGAQRASKVFKTQAEAIESAKKIAKNKKSELLIHGKNGRIRERNSYGNDPPSTKRLNKKHET